jgi:hypothetical protein
LLHEYVELETLRPPLRTDRAARKRFQIPAPYEFAVSFHTYVKRIGCDCPLCGHSEEEDSLEEEEAVSKQVMISSSSEFSQNADHILNCWLSFQLLFFSEDHHFCTGPCCKSTRSTLNLTEKRDRAADTCTLVTFSRIDGGRSFFYVCRQNL